jgi:hypothetical protein
MTPMQATAELYRLAQATALIRVFNETAGDEKRFVELMERNSSSDGKIVPSDADKREVEREHPELAALAATWNGRDQ